MEKVKIKILLYLLCLTMGLFFSCKTSRITKQPIEKELNYIPYYLKVYEADSLFIVGDYQRSYEILDTLFHKYHPLQMRMYYEVTNYYKLKIILKKNIGRKDFYKLLSEYGVTDQNFKNDSLLSIYYKKNKKDIDENYNQLRQKYISTINVFLRNEIKAMVVEDQLYRKKDYKANIDKQNTIDSINEKKMIKILNDFGFPDEKLIGDYNIDEKMVNARAIFLHTKDSIRLNYFLPVTLEFIKKGKLAQLDYATMKDQYNLYHGMPQYYGSYSNKTDIPVKELNQRRRSIGLPNYGYEKWRYNKLYPNEEY